MFATIIYPWTVLCSNSTNWDTRAPGEITDLKCLDKYETQIKDYLKLSFTSYFHT